MSYYNQQQQPPVWVPPPQGYPPNDACPPPGYPQEGYPPQGYPRDAQQLPQNHGGLEGWSGKIPNEEQVGVNVNPLGPS